MIGSSERHKALRMLGSKENVRGVVDANGLIAGRMEYQKCLVQIGDTVVNALLGDIMKKLTLDTERSPGELYFDLALLADLVDVLLEKTNDMRRIAGRRNSHDRARVRDPMRGGKRGCATKTMSDQDRGRAVRPSQVVGCGDQIIDVGRKMRVSEFAFAHPESGEIEPQNANAACRQPFGNALGCHVIFATRKAVREQCKGNRFAEWEIN